jgi:uncharacterized membrane protein
LTATTVNNKITAICGRTIAYVIQREKIKIKIEPSTKKKRGDANKGTIHTNKSQQKKENIQLNRPRKENMKKSSINRKNSDTIRKMKKNKTTVIVELVVFVVFDTSSDNSGTEKKKRMQHQRN